MKKTLSLVFNISLSVFIFAQTLNPTQSIITPGSADSFRGGYTFAYSASGTPWNGSLLSFGGFSNNYDTQISADYGVNGGSHISFRTRNGDHNAGAGMWNSWNEIWHAGNLNNPSSNITGKDLHAYGLLKVTEYSPVLYLDRNTSTGGYIQGVQTRLHDGTNNWFFGNFHADSFIINAGGYDSARLFTLARSGNASLQGKFEAKEVKVTTTPTADFVFEEGYSLPKLEDVEKHIKEKKHLPEIASAREMEQDGVNIGEFQIKLLQKIEELTLYAIEQERQNREQREQIRTLQSENRQLKTLTERLERLEKAESGRPKPLLGN